MTSEAKMQSLNEDANDDAKQRENSGGGSRTRISVVDSDVLSPLSYPGV